MNRSPSRMLIGAAIAFAVAVFLFGGALLRAFSTDATLLPPPAPAPAVTEDETGEANKPLTADALQLAVENDPFSPERTAPAERYRLPGDVEPEPPAPPPPPPPPPPFQLTGTVITENASMALIAVGDVPPRMMSLGESLMGYRLTSVGAESAVMSNDENNINLRVPAPSRVVASGPNQRGNQRGQTPQQQRANQVSGALLQQLVERARAAGASPQMLESIMRMVSERGLEAIQNLEIGPNGFTVRSGNGNAVMRMQETREVPVRPQQTLPRPRPDTMSIPRELP
jgi:hypothetical protein